MKPLSTTLGVLTLALTLAPVPAIGQQIDAGSAAPHLNTAYRSVVFDLHPELTKDEFEEFAAELGSVLRFRQLGDATTLGRGKVDFGVELATSAIDDRKAAWNSTTSRPTASYNLARSLAFPRVVGRFGVSDRVDVGAWGGLNPRANYGLVGGDARIVVVREGPARPVTFSIRPSVTTLVGPAEVWAAYTSLDLSVSRAFGRFSPYAGVATTASVAVERSKDVDLDPATATRSLAFAGLSYRWRALVVSGEVEKGARVGYAFRLGTQF
jgi:hypothetical protein